MYTTESALETLHRYDIGDQDLLTWEKALGLNIPTDTAGHKLYSPHHINLFKNVKKHIALGRTLEEIKSIITLPPLEDSKTADSKTHDASERISVEAPVGLSAIRGSVAPADSELSLGNSVYNTQPSISGKTNAYTSAPTAPNRAKPSTGGAAGVVELVQKLSSEKDHLYRKLLETEKLNSHLYSANNMYHRRLKDLTDSLQRLQSQLNVNENFKLLDDKSKLHRLMIEAEKALQDKDFELRKAKESTEALNQTITQLGMRIESLTRPLDHSAFCGDWMENGHLVELVYDNFGINVEPERVRLFRISKTPDRVFGTTAVITTNYQYETNTLWKRQETLVATLADGDTLEGEVTAEYILDGVPVAKAIYRVTCKRNG